MYENSDEFLTFHCYMKTNETENYRKADGATYGYHDYLSLNTQH